MDVLRDTATFLLNNLCKSLLKVSVNPLPIAALYEIQHRDEIGIFENQHETATVFCGIPAAGYNASTVVH